MKTYTAQAERDEGGWWAVTVPALPGVFTQARRLDRVEDLARDAIALWLEAPIRSFEVKLEARVPDLDEEIAETIRARQLAEELRDEANRRSRHLARQLAARDVTVRDIGQILGVSHQRAAQLVDNETPRSQARRPAPAKRRAPVEARKNSDRVASKKIAKRPASKKKRAPR